MAELNWKLPDKDGTYNRTLIYTSTAKYGTYSLLATLTNIRLNKYVDTTGTLATWYKIRWFDSVNSIYSNYSQPFRAAGVISDTNYTTPKLVAQQLGRLREVKTEPVGTGDSSTAIWQLADPHVIADTEVIYLAGVAQRRNLDYTVDYDTGKVTFTTIPGTVAITADYWSCTEVHNSQLEHAIQRAEDNINRRTGKTFYPPQDTTESIDSYDPLDTNPWAYEATTFNSTISQFRSSTFEFLTSRVIQLSHYPLTAMNQVLLNEQPTPVSAEAVGTGNGVLTNFTLVGSPVVYGSEIIYVAGIQVTNYTINYSTGTITFTGTPPTGDITADYSYCSGATVLSASDYFVNLENGTLILRATTAQVKKIPQIVTASYTYGYYSIPAIVEDLATREAAVNIMQSGVMGAPTQQSIIGSNVGYLLGEIRSLYDSLGRKFTVIRI
jgi:hypothetical protein